MKFDGIKVFSATKQKERDDLGDKATRWMTEHRENVDIVDCQLRQSSDSAYHCLTITLFYTKKS